jgi:hypothetical protein
MVTTFADAASRTCAVLYSNALGEWSLQYRSGYGGVIVSTTGSVPVNVPVPITLSYTTSTVTPRANALVVGRPPVSGGSDAYDPVPSLALIDATVELLAEGTTRTYVAYETETLGVDTTRSYAITTGVPMLLAV